MRSLISFSFAVISLCCGAPHADEAAQFELLHLWSEPVERYALSAFSEPLKKQGVAWSEQIVHENFTGVSSEYAARLAHGVPPTATFWIGGGEIAEDMVRRGIFRVVSDAALDPDLKTELKPEIYQNVHNADGFMVLPVGIHLQNYAVYNLAIMAESGVESIGSWEEFIVAAEKVSEAGYIPLSTSDQLWQLRFLIGAIMVEYLTADELKDLLSNRTIGGRQRDALLKTFDILKRLAPYINDDFRDLSWADSFRHVAEGRAMANFLGDFVAPLLPSDDGFRCGLPPGNNYLTWSFDSIALTDTRDPDEIHGQDMFVKMVLDRARSVEYVARKGGVPVFRETEITPIWPCAKASIEQWEKSKTRLLLASKDWTAAMSMISGAARALLFEPERDVEPLVDELIAMLSPLAGPGPTEDER